MSILPRLAELDPKTLSRSKYLDTCHQNLD